MHMRTGFSDLSRVTVEVLTKQVTFQWLREGKPYVYLEEDSQAKETALQRPQSRQFYPIYSMTVSELFISY